MAKRLIDAGFGLVVYNRSRPAVDELVSYGAAAAETPKAVAEQATIVISIVTDTPDVEEIALGEAGVLAGARPGTIYVDMSTISPDTIRKIGESARPKGVGVVDAPVSGGQIGAENGTLSIMVGGDPDDVERCLPLFRVMGSHVVHVGELGSGQMVKICNQVICGLNLLATCEGLALAAKAGLDLSKVYDVVTRGAAGSWALQNLGRKMIERDFAPAFKISLQQKDLRIALETAAALQVPLPGTALVHQLLRVLEVKGKSDEGTQALIRLYEELGDLVVNRK